MTGFERLLVSLLAFAGGDTSTPAVRGRWLLRGVAVGAAGVAAASAGILASTALAEGTARGLVHALVPISRASRPHS